MYPIPFQVDVHALTTDVKRKSSMDFRHLVPKHPWLSSHLSTRVTLAHLHFHTYYYFTGNTRPTNTQVRER